MKNFTKLLMGGAQFSSTSSVFRHVFLTMLCLVFGTGMALADTQSIRTSVDLPNSAGYTLRPGYMYIVRQDMVINATAGNGLNVAKGAVQAPILYIPAGVTLTVKGADGSGMTGGGAGIYVPSGANLIITGAGTLNATGGNAASGQDGVNGKNPHDYTGSDAADWADWTKLSAQSHETNMVYSGAGGRGGNGGGGAGAGIGGIGGAGGQGGAGGASVGNGDRTVDGNPGSAGGKGSAGVSMGKVYVTGTVTVNANSGSAGAAGGKVGQQGYSFIHEGAVVLFDGYYIAGAGGGGGGGAAGAAAPHGIGAGAPGAGGGAGGGSGAFDQVVRGSFSRVDNNSCRASSGNGGNGGVPGGSPSNERKLDTGRSGQFILNICPQKGGVGGNGGAQGDNGTADKLFVGPNAHVNDNSVTRTSDAGASAPGDMQITITFINNELNEDGSKATNVHVGAFPATIGETLPAAVATTYLLKAKDASDQSDKYFAGYFTSDLGMGDRIYKGFASGDNLEAAVNAVPFAKDATVYAHFVHVHHIINWDYTYSNGLTPDGTKSAWENINTSEKLKRGKLVFYHSANGNREKLGEVVMNVILPNPDTQDGANYIYVANPSAGLEYHTRAQGKIYLVTSGTEQLNTNQDITVVIADDKLVKFNDYEFIPWDNTHEKTADQWMTIVDREAHQTVFSFTGAEGNNQYVQKWEVKLTGLKVYPSSIYAKPMYLSNSDPETWSLISQLPEKYNGVTCYPDEEKSSRTGDPESTYVTYTGEYPVWIKHNDVYWKYRVGLVGYTLDGIDYFMDATQGAVHDDMISPKGTGDDNVGTGQHIITIEYTKPASEIPVLRMIANGGQFAGGYAYKMEVNESRSGSFPLSSYAPTRAGYVLDGWNTQEDGSGEHYATSGTAIPGSNALTLYAEWKDNVPPVITTDHMEYAETKATVFVNVVDATSGVKSVEYYFSNTAFDPSEITSGWTDATHVGEGSLYSFDVDELPYAYICVKATDNKDNVGYAYSENVKTDGIAPTYEIYPTGNVCNFPVEITSKDNNSVAKIEISRDGGNTWNDVTSSATGSDVEKLYTEAKLNDTYVGETNTPVKLSLRITDAANNVTEYDNFTNMYYGHIWDTEHSHTVEVPNGDGTYTKRTYYSCTHECGHIWVVDWEVDGKYFGEPGDNGTGESESDKAGYDRNSTFTDESKEKLYQEQGLMREDTKEFIFVSGTVIVTDAEGNIHGVANDINGAIEQTTTDNNTLVLVDNTIIADKGSEETGSAVIVTPANEVTIDLNGHGLLIDGTTPTSGDITGNEKVTILLKDGNKLEYTNTSTITGSPIMYTRNFTVTQENHWQAIYLPFAVTSLPSGYDFGTIKEATIADNTAGLVIDKEVTSLDANAPYTIRAHAAGAMTINVAATNAELKPYAEPTSGKIGTGADDASYHIKGSLKLSDNQSDAKRAFWLLTNGGKFMFVAANQQQVPYRWVIYEPANSEHPQGTSLSRVLALFTIGEDYEPTAVNFIDAEEADADAPIYTLSGTRVSNEKSLAPGLYIRGGKKFIIR